MKEYFVNPGHFIVQSVFMTLILGALAFGSISTGDPAKIVIGIACLLILAGVYWWAWSQAKRPAVRIGGNSVTVRGGWGRVQKIEDVGACHLVVSITWIGFRRAGQPDVIIGRGRFSRLVWLDLEARLRALPVAGIDAPLPARPPARWVAPTLFFFGVLFVLIAVQEWVTGGAGTAGLKSVPRHIARASAEPGTFYPIMFGNLSVGVALLLTSRQQWRLGRATAK